MAKNYERMWLNLRDAVAIKRILKFTRVGLLHVLHASFISAHDITLYTVIYIHGST